MAAKMKEEAKKKLEEQIGEQAPGSVKGLFGCCGGPVKTMETCMCMVPADKQETVKGLIQKFKEM